MTLVGSVLLTTPLITVFYRAYQNGSVRAEFHVTYIPSLARAATMLSQLSGVLPRYPLTEILCGEQATTVVLVFIGNERSNCNLHHRN
jgi:hypothetical protein